MSDDKRRNSFNIFRWSERIPLCDDDLYLGMQARNIALVDQGIIRGIEKEALEAWQETERTPGFILIHLSALSQMWIYSLYEFLRTWRHRARLILAIADKRASMPEGQREAYLAVEIDKVKARERLVMHGLSHQSEQMAKVADDGWVAGLRTYMEGSHGLYRGVEYLRMTLAKHEIPKSDLIAEAPGYGRMSYKDGSMYWAVNLKDGTQVIVSRRELADEFLGIVDDPI